MALAVAVAGLAALVLLGGWAAKLAGGAAIAVLALLVVRFVRGWREAERERQLLSSRVEEVGGRDPLTGLFRRRRLEEELRRELALSSRLGQRVAVLDLCLDGFSHAEEAYGKQTSDELTLAAAEVLEHATRESDLTAYAEGGEFLVLVPAAGEESARIVAGKLIRALRAVIRPRPGGGVIELRASIGVALSKPDAPVGAADLLEDAAKALARAKEEGGDRFFVADALVAGY